MNVHVVSLVRTTTCHPRSSWQHAPAPGCCTSWSSCCYLPCSPRTSCSPQDHPHPTLITSTTPPNHTARHIIHQARTPPPSAGPPLPNHSLWNSTRSWSPDSLRSSGHFPLLLQSTARGPPPSTGALALTKNNGEWGRGISRQSSLPGVPPNRLSHKC